MTGARVLDVAGLGKTWDDGHRRVDIDIDRLTLQPGSFKVIVGQSGSGKSTALDMISLVRTPDRVGHVALVGADDALADISHDVQRGREEALCAYRRASYAYIVQTSELMPFLRVSDDIAMQQRLSGRGSRDLARDYAQALDITDCLSQFPAALSVGQRQRAAVVRAAAAQPRILLADEPTAALDPELKSAVITVFKHLASLGTAVLMVTHDFGLIEQHHLPYLKTYSTRTATGWQTRFVDAEEAG